MVKDPHKPRSLEPDEALDLLRELAHKRAANPGAPVSPEDVEKLDALRDLAAKLDLQLRSQPGGGAAAVPPQSARSRPATRDPRRQTMPDPVLNDARTGTPAGARRQPRAPVRGGDRRGQWAEFVAALPPAAALVPRLGLHQQIFAVLSVVVLAVAAAGGVIAFRNAPDRAMGPQIVPPIEPEPAQAPAQSPAEIAPPDIPAIQKAMSECDGAAAREPDALYFLILPLVPVNRNDLDWRAVALQTIGNSYFLLSGKDALDGLRSKKLALRPGRYTFSALDTGNGSTYSWTSATGMSRLARRDSGAVKSLKLGFDFSPTQAGAQWSAEFKRDAGTCYWVSVLARD